MERIKKQLNRQKRVRLKLRKVSGRQRLSVFRSNRKIYAQIIDDKKGETLSSASEKDLGQIKEKKCPIEIGKEIGRVLAQKAKKKRIVKVSFDRGRYKYHGRVKALAEGAKEMGLKF